MSQPPNNPDTDKSPDKAGRQAFQVRVHAQYIKDLSFEVPNPAIKTLPDKTKPANIEMSIDVHAESRKEPANCAEIVLKILARAKHEDTVHFILELSYAGIFELFDVPAKNAEAVFLIEAPRQLFPFARRLVADLTREGGFPPLLLDPIDFMALYMNHRDNKGKQASVKDNVPPTH